MPLYKGPVWNNKCPKEVPIPVQQVPCKHQCCMREFIPLKIAYGRTLHTFQGQTAGPVPKGKTKNAVQTIIVHPGPKSFETINPGLMYMALSRATQLDTGEGRLDSAIYFSSWDMDPYRLKSMTCNYHGEEYYKPKMRRKWITKLEKNTRRTKMKKSRRKEILSWATSTKISRQVLAKHLSSDTWRTNESINY